MPSSFIDRDKVVKLLIRERCKFADKQFKQSQKNEFISRLYIPNKEKRNKYLTNELYQLFPPRRKWCHIGKCRKTLDTVSRNQQRLEHTYIKAKRSHCTEQWYKNLCEYADSIIDIADTRKTKVIPKPKVSVIEKKRPKGENYIECRPVCSFHLKLKIILSLLNKYLTKLFDPYFLNCSYAFRVPKKGQEMMQHLNAVKDIVAYRKKHIGEILYVAECDMQKFYDTINHNFIKTRFIILLNKAKRDGNIVSEDYKAVKQWFFMYIDCFDFLSCVNVYNTVEYSNPFWKNIKNKGDKKCIIKWVDGKELNKARAKRNKGKVGVPQGGALSGLIANIVMNDVDKAVVKAIDDEDILFCRFCDDMILIGNTMNRVKNVLAQYKTAIKKSKLIAHPHKPEVKEGEGMKSFWKGKTRGPYAWAERGEKIYPWITFVGFDVNWKGNLRIRKHSFKRQIEKQNKVANALIYPYQKGKQPRYCFGTIKASLKSRLIGMSVGRISLWNYNNNPNIRSWMSAFSILDENPWSAKQLKALDKHRAVVIARASLVLARIKCTNKKKEDNLRENQRNRFTYTGAPFSYYGQCFKYKNK